MLWVPRGGSGSTWLPLWWNTHTHIHYVNVSDVSFFPLMLSERKACTCTALQEWSVRCWSVCSLHTVTAAHLHSCGEQGNLIWSHLCSQLDRDWDSSYLHITSFYYFYSALTAQYTWFKSVCIYSLMWDSLVHHSAPDNSHHVSSFWTISLTFFFFFPAVMFLLPVSPESVSHLLDEWKGFNM